MTVGEAVARADRLRPNAFTEEEKIAWLSALDGMIFQEILKNHEDGPESFRGYDGETEREAVLLAPPPYDQELYTAFLESKMDRESGETARYNVSAALFNGAYLTFMDWYNRTHAPLRPVERFRL